MVNIPFKEMQGFIWLNNEIVDWHDANIHVLTHGLHYGSSVFEGIRIYEGKAFKLFEHMQRLHHSANVLGFEINYSVDELCKAANEQIALNKIENGYIRPVAWRGTETMLIGGGSKEANVAIAVWSTFEEKREQLRRDGIRMHFSKWRKPNPDASPYSAKAASIYTLCTLAKNDAAAAGFDDAIMIDSEDNITEGTTSNIFFIKDGELFTPLADRFLNGITRQTVINLAQKIDLCVHEGKISQDAFEDFDAAFLTGTAIEMMQIQSIENHKYQLNHSIYQKLCNAFNILVKESL